MKLFLTEFEKDQNILVVTYLNFEQNTTFLERTSFKRKLS